MNILVTGSKGFLGTNLVAELKNQNFTNIFEYDTNNDLQILEEYASNCDFVFHLAGVNRPKDEKEFLEGNFDFTDTLLKTLKNNNNRPSILLTSSIQSELDNPYGKSKKAAEDLLFKYRVETGSNVFVYRLPNVFGKWCRPNYNSVVATFCHNIACGLPIQLNDANTLMKLVYIDDVLKSFIASLKAEVSIQDDFCYVDPIYTVRLGQVAELLYTFRDSRENLGIPNMSNQFEKKLYSTFISYLPKDKLSYPLKMNVDSRGSFTEFVRTEDRGQFSVNISKPGSVKGNHWHHSKNEKFLVVCGRGLIRLKNIFSDEIIEYHVSGEKLEVVDIPTGYVHSITNISDVDMITLMWVNELFNPDKPDSYFQEV